MNRINIGIIGMGNIGSAVAAAIKKNRNLISGNTGIDLRVKQVCDLRRVKTSYPLTSDPYRIINDPDISVVVEAIGGIKPALKYILAALNKGKHVVTPNKEVIATHMGRILAAARKNGVGVFFEGAVGGGIPIIKPIRESLCANAISEVSGIVNGTTNYILSKMMEEGMEFSEALKKAQRLGFAEPDPAADIKGYDASYKAAILAAVAFNARVNWKDVYFEGIERITREDLQYAGEIGYMVKLLAIAKRFGDQIEVRVHPALVQKLHPLANVSDNYNAIYVKGEPVGQLMFFGPGAGGGPTASAIISDIIACANAECRMPNAELRNYRIRNINETRNRYYIRLQAPDKHGVLAGISRAFAENKVSIAAVVQKETVGSLATIVILVHEVVEKNLKAALKKIERLSVVKKVCNIIRIAS